MTTASKVNSTRLGGKKSKSQQQLLPSHQQQPAGMGTASEQQQQQNHSRSRLSSSASLSVLLQSPQHQQQAHQRHPLHQGRHQALGRATVGNRGGVRGGGGGGRGLSLTPVSTSSRVIKGGTRGLYAQVRLVVSFRDFRSRFVNIQMCPVYGGVSFGSVCAVCLLFGMCAMSLLVRYVWSIQTSTRSTISVKRRTFNRRKRGCGLTDCHSLSRHYGSWPGIAV